MLTFACDSFAAASEAIMARARRPNIPVRPAADRACIRRTTTNSCRPKGRGKQRRLFLRGSEERTPGQTIRKPYRMFGLLSGRPRTRNGRNLGPTSLRVLGLVPGTFCFWSSPGPPGGRAGARRVGRAAGRAHGRRVGWPAGRSGGAGLLNPEFGACGGFPCSLAGLPFEGTPSSI